MRKRIGLALVAALLAGELFLQAASVLVRGLGSRAEADPASEAITILCVGDSHTYGLPLPREESYPAQLERRLSERHPDRRFQVVNLGIPGTNSGYVANRLERQLLQLRPRLVLVWVGINNSWNAVEAEGGGAAGALHRLLLRSRLYRLASIAWYTRTGHQYDPAQHGGWFEGEESPSRRREPDASEVDALAPGLARDLARIVETSRALETPVALLAYPMRKQKPLNLVIERAAFESDVPVVDTIRALERGVARGHAIPALIDTSAGPHPTGLLYGYVVDELLPVVESALGLAGEAPAP
jgi:hypothetical protein